MVFIAFLVFNSSTSGGWTSTRYEYQSGIFSLKVPLEKGASRSLSRSRLSGETPMQPSWDKGLAEKVIVATTAL
jgi:hypothetical protein